MAKLPATGWLIAMDVRAANNDVPAEGPSFGVAPIGICK
jgi:hypothetical protein